MTNVKSALLKHNKRAKRILTPLVVVFADTMLPLSILPVTVVFWPEIIGKEYYSNLIYAVVVSAIVTSSANPVIYSVVSRNFRKGINNLCLRRHYPARVKNTRQNTRLWSVKVPLGSTILTRFPLFKSSSKMLSSEDKMQMAFNQLRAHWKRD